MNEREFFFWIKGFKDIGSLSKPTEEQWRIILDHIELVENGMNIAPVNHQAKEITMLHAQLPVLDCGAVIQSTSSPIFNWEVKNQSPAVVGGSC